MKPRLSRGVVPEQLFTFPKLAVWRGGASSVRAAALPRFYRAQLTRRRHSFARSVFCVDVRYQYPGRFRASSVEVGTDDGRDSVLQLADSDRDRYDVTVKRESLRSVTTAEGCGPPESHRQLGSTCTATVRSGPCLRTMSSAQVFQHDTAALARGLRCAGSITAPID